MGSSVTGNGEEEIQQSNGSKTAAQIPFDVSASRKTLLSDQIPQRRPPPSRFTAFSTRLKFLNFGSASISFRRMAEERDEMSRSVDSSSGHHLRERLQGVFSRRIDWVSLRSMCREWFRDPMNMALFVWISCVAISGAILFLVMTGMLNAAIPEKSQRNAWFEVNNQILNALFTLMCLYNHPKRFYHLVLLCKWRPEDITRLRKIYCKNGTYKPHEWAHMMVVVILLHLNCFAQYALCGLNWGFKRSERPAIGVGICISFAIGAPAFAGVYSMLSPLGRDYDSELDEEAQVQKSDLSRRLSFERRYSFASRDEGRIVESRPEWSGGIFDFWDDLSLAYLSLFCSFCVFGWNMERLGFGNMYVHIATFILFCLAPFWIFNLAAVNIDNEAVREALGLTGVILCVFGLLYGGFWRIQMRKRYNLPAYHFCFGRPAFSDCTLWLCCWWCTLAQEVRTGNAYDVVEDKFCRKLIDNPDQLISPLPREDGATPYRSDTSSPIGNFPSPSKNFFSNSPSPRKASIEQFSSNRQLSAVKEEPHLQVTDDTMIPPSPSLITREEA